jgi:drug/metabolite transporter (DMT)-like permease
MTTLASTHRKSHLDTLAVTSLLVCCFLWGLNQVAAKAAMPEVPPLWQAASRSLGGAVLVWLWARWRGIELFKTDATLRGGLLAGALFAAEFICIFIGLQFTTASRMVVFIYISPFIVALGMPFIAKAETLSRQQIAGLLIAFAGVTWAFAEGFTKPAAGQHQLIGDALGVLAGVLWGATTLAIRGTKLSTAPAEKTLLYQLAISGLILAACALIAGSPVPSSLSTLAWSSMAFQIVIVTAFSYVVWFWLIKTYPATRLASFTLLTPVFGLLLGSALLGEPITPRLIVAVVTVAAGILLVNRRPAVSRT